MIGALTAVSERTIKKKVTMQDYPTQQANTSTQIEYNDKEEVIYKKTKYHRDIQSSGYRGIMPGCLCTTGSD